MLAAITPESLAAAFAQSSLGAAVEVRALVCIVCGLIDIYARTWRCLTQHNTTNTQKTHRRMCPVRRSCDPCKRRRQRRGGGEGGRMEEEEREGRR